MPVSIVLCGNKCLCEKSSDVVNESSLPCKFMVCDLSSYIFFQLWSTDSELQLAGGLLTNRCSREQERIWFVAKSRKLNL